jgi:transglutaminase-like putative cysteine protease
MIHLRVPLLILSDIVLIAAAVICTIGTWITAFSLPVNIFPLLLVILGAVVMFTFAANCFRYKGVFIASLLILIPLILSFQDIFSGLRSVIFVFTRELTLWTYVPVLFPGSMPQNSEVTIFLIAMGLILTVLLSMIICIRLSTALTIALTIPLCLFTFIIMDNPPNMAFLIILVGVYITVLVTNMLNINSKEKQSHYLDNLEEENSILAKAILGKKTAFLKIKTFPVSVKTFYGKTKILPALLIAALLLIIAGVVAPQNSRLNIDLAESLNHQTRQLLSRLGIIPSGIGYGWLQFDGEYMFFDTNTLRVSDAGNRIFHDVDLLEITVNRPGVFYLRGFSLDEFDGRTWHRSSVSRDGVDEELSRQVPTLISMRHSYIFPYYGTYPVQITIQHTGDVTEDITYIPYYSILNPMIINEYGGENEPLLELDDTVHAYDDIYSFDFFHNSLRSIHNMRDRLDQQLGHLEQLSEYADFLDSTGLYRSIDPSTAEILRQIAQNARIDLNADRIGIVNQVAEFIVTRGSYTHTPPRTPEGVDFAIFFLEVSRLGYCIHFATAATLMLRALDVPARFTAGYLVHITQSNVDNTVILTDRNAHAWVEVFFDDLGWVPIDVTPAFVPGPGGTANPISFENGGFSGDFLTDEMMYWMYGMYGEGAGYFDDFFNLDFDMTQGEEQEPWQGFVRIIIWVVSAIIILAVFAILHTVSTRIIRRKRFVDRDTNAAVIRISRYVTNLTKKNDDLVPKQIRNLAFKAYFSQHIISEEERAQMLDFSVKLRSDIYSRKGKLGRFVMNYILVL